MIGKFLFCSSLCFALLLMGCGSSGESNSNNRTGDNSSTTKPAETKSPDTTTTSGVTGVAACDEYLSRVEKCMNNPNVPQATKDIYKQSLEQNRAAWKQAASTPQGKASLESSCKTALDAAKTFLDSCK